MEILARRFCSGSGVLCPRYGWFSECIVMDRCDEMVGSLDMKEKEQREIGMDEHRTEGATGDTSALKDLHVCGYTTTPTPSSGWVVGVIQFPKSYPHTWPIPTLCKQKLPPFMQKPL